MAKGIALRSHEQRMMHDLFSALGASLDLHTVLKDAYRLLLPLVGADFGALATGRSERPEEYQWIVQDLPPSFLGSYEEMAPHDFVRKSVQARLNVVVRDAEMIERRELERNIMYHRAREVGSPLEQVMAVMLHAGRGFQSGLSLYRAKRRPFNERDQWILQQIAPAIGNTVRNCQLFAREARRGAVLEKLLGSDERAVVVVRPPLHEVDRTAKATTLLDAWFPQTGHGSDGLPRPLLQWLAEAQAASAQGRAGRWSRKLPRDAGELEVEIFSVTEPGGGPFWVISLDEVPRAPRLRDDLQARLTKREREVVSALLRGWDIELIAQELGCMPNTVKKHAQRSYEKLGVEGRTKLFSLAVYKR